MTASRLGEALHDGYRTLDSKEGAGQTEYELWQARTRDWQDWAQRSVASRGRGRYGWWP